MTNTKMNLKEVANNLYFHLNKNKILKIKYVCRYNTDSVLQWR